MNSIRSMQVSAWAALALGLTLVASGCAQKAGEDSTVEKTSTTETVAATETPAAATTLEGARQAGAIAAEIAKEPARSVEILKAHGMTTESYQAVLYDIAADAALTDAYEDARTSS